MLRMPWDVRGELSCSWNPSVNCRHFYLSHEQTCLGNVSAHVTGCIWMRVNAFNQSWNVSKQAMCERSSVVRKPQVPSLKEVSPIRIQAPATTSVASYLVSGRVNAFNWSWKVEKQAAGAKIYCVDTVRTATVTRVLASQIDTGDLPRRIVFSSDLSCWVDREPSQFNVSAMESRAYHRIPDPNIFSFERGYDEVVLRDTLKHWKVTRCIRIQVAEILGSLRVSVLVSVRGAPTNKTLRRRLTTALDSLPLSRWPKAPAEFQDDRHTNWLLCFTAGHRRIWWPVRLLRELRRRTRDKQTSSIQIELCGDYCRHHSGFSAILKRPRWPDISQKLFLPVSDAQISSFLRILSGGVVYLEPVSLVTRFDSWTGECPSYRTMPGETTCHDPYFSRRVISPEVVSKFRLRACSACLR